MSNSGRFNGKCRIVDTDSYHNIAPALGEVVPCVIEVFPDGDLLYHISPVTLEKFGCIMGTSPLALPFFDSEVEEVERGDEV